MDNNTESVIETLNDLVKINYDRVKGYEKASEELKSTDVDLHAMFLKMASESKENIAALNERIIALGGEADDDSSISGDIHRTWMDIKNAFTGHDRTAILESCEFGEDAIQKAYKEALDPDEDMDPASRSLVSNQKEALKGSHDTVKKYRDLHKEVNS